MHRPRRGRENAGLQIAPTLKQDVWNAPNSVMDNVSRLEGQVFSLRFELQNVDNLFLDWTYSPVMNRVKRGLDVEVTIKLKEWTEDTVLELLWTSMGSTDRKGSRPLVSDSTGCRKAGDPFGRLQDRQPGRCHPKRRGPAAGEPGELRDTAMLLQVQCDSYGISGPEYQQNKDGGVLTISNFHTGVYGCFEKVPKTTDHVFRLLGSGELAAEQAAKPGGEERNDAGRELSAEPAARPDRARSDYFGNGGLTTQCQKGGTC